jgi:glycosyltransferase involved in cell wall biosynthesis
MYMPIVSEGASCSAGQPILFSGVSVYLEQASAAFRALPLWADSVLAARPLLGFAGQFAGRTRPEDVGELTVSMLAGAEGNQTREIDRLVRWLSDRPRADVIVLSNSLFVGLAAPLQDALGVPVVCTVQGEAHFVRAMGEPWTSQAWEWLAKGLRACAGRVAVSRFAAEDLAAEIGLSPDDFEVAHNGIDLDGYGPPEPTEPAVVGFFARMYARKGVGTLADAFALLREEGRDVRLRFGGTLNAGDEPDVRSVMAQLQRAGLGDHVEMRADLSPEDKRAFLRDLTVFCVPTAKDDTFGLYNLEAMAAGVPVVAPRRGALPEVLEATEAVTWCAPDDPVDTARAIASLLDAPTRRQALASRGREAVHRDFGEPQLAQRYLAAVERILEAP